MADLLAGGLLSPGSGRERRGLPGEPVGAVSSPPPGASVSDVWIQTEQRGICRVCWRHRVCSGGRACSLGSAYLGQIVFPQMQSTWNPGMCLI